jgi:ribonuclease Z
MMQLYFLGTGAGMPSNARNVSALALNVLGERNATWLFDCGEGTQHAILKSPIKLSKLEFIFITHLHGDHIFGLPGLLSSRSNYGNESPITIFGPVGIKQFIETSFKLSDTHLRYEINYVEWSSPDMGEILYEDDQFVIKIAPLIHRIPSCGYRIEEKSKPGQLRVDLLERDQIPPGPDYAKIKQQEFVVLEDGRRIESSTYLGPSIPGRILAVAGDTKICEGSRYLLANANVAVHEATFNDEFAHLAGEYFHSTAREVATIAKEVNTTKLILTHLSARYNLEDANHLLSEALQQFENTHIAFDHFSCEINVLK